MADSPPSPPEWLTLEDGERVWLRVAPSRNLVLAALAVGFVLLLAMSVGVSAMSDLGTGRAVSLTVLVVIVGLLVFAFLLTKRAEYVLTDRRVCAGVGFGSKRVETLDVDAVTDVTVEQSRLERLVDVGSVRFVADGEAELTFSLVGNPAHLQERVFDVVAFGA